MIEEFPEGKYDVPQELKADANIICKWHHFYDGSFIESLRELSDAPVFYWVWDYMYDQGFPDWHLKMAKAADLYLTNEGGLIPNYRSSHGVKAYYFPMDVCDGDLPVFEEEKIYDVVFPGSYLKQGERIPFLKEINKEIPVKIFAWNHEEWVKEGFDASPALYGAGFNKMIAQSKVVLGFSVEPHCWGYWSNRVGKVLVAGGNLLYQYAPGMESLPVHTFVTVQEAIDKIKDLRTNYVSPFKTYTSGRRIGQLNDLINAYLKEGLKWNTLP